MNSTPLKKHFAKVVPGKILNPSNSNRHAISFAQIHPNISEKSGDFGLAFSNIDPNTNSNSVYISPGIDPRIPERLSFYKVIRQNTDVPKQSLLGKTRLQTHGIHPMFFEFVPEGYGSVTLADDRGVNFNTESVVEAWNYGHFFLLEIAQNLYTKTIKEVFCYDPAEIYEPIYIDRLADGSYFLIAANLIYPDLNKHCAKMFYGKPGMATEVDSQIYFDDNRRTAVFTTPFSDNLRHFEINLPPQTFSMSPNIDHKIAQTEAVNNWIQDKFGSIIQSIIGEQPVTQYRELLAKALGIYLGPTVRSDNP